MVGLYGRYYSKLGIRRLKVPNAYGRSRLLTAMDTPSGEVANRSWLLQKLEIPLHHVAMDVFI